ncbi:MAG: hypothetical protein IJH32_09005 [Ruminococcus sp.]|nr:hypothetical protein [Ruminococcus sp.]
MKNRILKVLCVFLPFLLFSFLFTVSAFAKDASLSLDVSGMLKAGKTFDVTLSCGVPVCAVQLDISYDTKMIDYASVKADSSDGTVRYRKTDKGVSLIYASATAKSGALFICKFKALQNGESAVLFSPVSAAASGEEHIDIDKSVTLKLSVGNNASYQTAASPKASSSLSESGARSLSDSKSTPDESVSKELLDFHDPYYPVIQKILITAGFVLLSAAMLFLGILIGKRCRRKPDVENTDVTENNDNDKTESPDNNEKS